MDTAFGASDGYSVSLNAIAESAQVPVASVYHFFPVPEAALAALAERYTELAAIEVMSNHSIEKDRNWQGVVNSIFSRGQVFFGKYPAAKKLRYAPHQSASARHILLESNWGLAAVIEQELARLFKLPMKASLIDDLAYAIAISDALWSLSIALHGEVTDELALEAERAVTAFLLPLLGSKLSPIASEQSDKS